MASLDPKNIGVYFRSKRGRYLALLSAGISLLSTSAWVILDEFVLNWTSWLPDWPSLIANGLVPLAIVLLGLAAFDEGLKKSLHANAEERILALFIFLFVALIVLTIIGIFFRGPGMSLYWPWDLAAAHN